MKPSKLLVMLLMLALFLAACAPAPTAVPATEESVTQAPAASPTEALSTESPEAETATSAETATAEGSAETATVVVPVTGGATVEISESTDFGPILVNGEGMSLYAFMGDTQNSDTSACTGDCAIEWPPLTTDGQPVAGEGVDETLLGTISRDDGATQVTYNGWPLYLYEEDAAPGDTNGQGVEDEFGLWFLVSPAGEPIQQ